ncbi:5-carboxymethyl-2-hydroxymuconate Delta-isomerase [Streptomyces chromofuscus]|uniref:5-carboxymethyl-2-hydroxymuconate Delta-isomerase n=1 Tax=Streptomyces chromofuscus TaxID=42881 RepID=A0A7M2TC73_STRCW|nr:5-carboxymethyl-2-hydroxymuconate Delta-isomerase [Streptomyces chromofuscus]QOV46296.1 5-carboxymethyl-2-hydroxymuconate Delta-isomerase [Streptomyces chromofuscus]GGS95653.1 isomerase [Streptomyces chromofuscus]
MPQITVDYSASLADDFERPAFARALHSTVVEIAAAKPPACKTQFRPTEDTMVGDETEGHAVVHVTLGLLAGRTDDTKARLTEAVLDLLRQHVKPHEGRTLHASAEVRDLDPSYRKFDS